MNNVAERLTSIDQRLERLEKSSFQTQAGVRALLENLRPSMSFSEVKQATGYASKGAARKWLRDHGVQRSGKGWRRVQVIAALAEGKR